MYSRETGAGAGEGRQVRRRGRRRPARPGKSKKATLRRWARAINALVLFAAVAGG